MLLFSCVLLVKASVLFGLWDDLIMNRAARRPQTCSVGVWGNGHEDVAAACCHGFDFSLVALVLDIIVSVLLGCCSSMHVMKYRIMS